MLETLTQGFTAARERLSGVRELSEENVAEALREIGARTLFLKILGSYPAA